MEKLDSKSMDLEKSNVEEVKLLFPNVVAEGKIDFEKLRLMLGEELEERNEKYQFTWNGKSKAIKLAQSPSTATLRPVKEDSVNWDTTENLYIEGDNLEVLKQLQKTYFGKIKMIYIDPPYNTGGDFVYKDDFTDSIANYKEQTNQTHKSNADTAGRYHTDWLNMMYPRLLLAKNLMMEDGFIFISIDENEVTNLKKISDEIFGESNFVNKVSVFSKVSAGASGGGEDKRLKKNIEYLLIYTKNYNALGAVNPIYKETDLITYIKRMKEDGKSFKYTNVLYKSEDVEYFKTIKDGSGDDIKIYKVNNYEIKTINQICKDEKITQEKAYDKYFDKVMTTTNAQTSIRQRVWDSTDSENNMYKIVYVPKSGKNKGKDTELIFMGKQKVLVIWLKSSAERSNKRIVKKEKIGTYWDGFSWINVTKEGGIKFANGKKPIDLMIRMMNLTSSDKNFYVLDFFSGSGSTAHAVMKKNALDQGNRKFILIQLPEKTSENSEEYKLGYNNICELGKDRLRKSGDSILETSTSIDVGFKVFKLEKTNIKEWDSSVEVNENTLFDHLELIKEDRTKEDVLYEILLKYGVFNQKVKTISFEGRDIYDVSNGYMIVDLNDTVTEDDIKKIIELKPQVVVLLESSFSNDNDKLNAEYTLKRNGVKDIKCI